MNNASKVPGTFVFMKVGNHAGEDFESILKRKNRERERAGRIFWGYGGSVCHPLMQVQPFARQYIKNQGGDIFLLMEPVNSKADPDIDPAKEYSSDGANWQAIPDGIEVTGSRYALVLDEIHPVDIEISLQDYIVGVGHSRGKVASGYVLGRVDKACLTRTNGHQQLLEPYAVLLR